MVVLLDYVSSDRLYFLLYLYFFQFYTRAGNNSVNESSHPSSSSPEERSLWGEATMPSLLYPDSLTELFMAESLTILNMSRSSEENKLSGDAMGERDTGLLHGTSRR